MAGPHAGVSLVLANEVVERRPQRGPVNAATAASNRPSSTTSAHDSCSWSSRSLRCRGAQNSQTLALSGDVCSRGERCALLTPGRHGPGHGHELASRPIRPGAARVRHPGNGSGVPRDLDEMQLIRRLLVHVEHGLGGLTRQVDPGPEVSQDETTLGLQRQVLGHHLELAQ
jgi:hypothetical protein